MSSEGKKTEWTTMNFCKTTSERLGRWIKKEGNYFNKPAFLAKLANDFLDKEGFEK